MKSNRLFLVPALLGAACAMARSAPGPARQITVPPPPAFTPIPLTPAMFVSEDALGNPAPLVDEPNARDRGETPKSSFEPGWDAWKYPLHYYVDLGKPYRLRRVSLYDGQGAGDVEVSTGQPFGWKPLFTDPLDHYQTWNDHDADVVTRYVRLTLAKPGVSLPEIALYGESAGGGRVTLPVRAATARTPPPAPPPTFDKFIGTNAFIDDPQDKMQAVGFVREYHSWAWDEGDGGAYAGYPNNLVRFNPSAAAGGNSWFFDDYYTKLHQAGIETDVCVQGSVSWLVGSSVSGSVKAVRPGRDAADPASYIEHAAYLYQFAVRYGGRKVSDTNLKLAANQPRVSGLGLVRYVEDWNEQDKTWEGRAARFTPYEYAAMASADRDGHQGRMGKVGVKSADPNVKLVMGGIAGLHLEYIEGIKRWCDFNRNGDFALDVINLHHYSNDGGEQGMGKTGISPEADHLREKLVPFVQWRNRYAPRAEVWLTEFGYDTHPASPQRAPAIGPYSQEEVQAQWIVRSYLALGAAGVDRAAQFMLRDVNPQDATQFSTSGLVTQKGEWKPKPAWFYVATLKTRLAGMRFTREVPSGSPNVKVYAFARAGQTAYVIWCPTSDGTTVERFRLPLPRAVRATIVSLVVGQANGNAVALPVVGGAATLEVSERPRIVLVPGPRAR